MANNVEVVTDISERAANISNRLKALYWDSKEFLNHNSAYSIDWGNGSKPAVIQEDADGNISGQNFDRTQLANVIGSLDNFVKLMSNQAISQGDHLGNIEKLSNTAS